MINTDIISTKQKTPARLQDAIEILKRNHKFGWTLLDEIFNEGYLPKMPLDGRTSGQMVAAKIAPILTPMVEKLLRSKMPWTGKTFDAANAQGENIFWRSSMPFLKLMSPFYKTYQEDGPETIRAYKFKTYVGKAMQDPEKDVLKIDYNDSSNPALSIRRIMDELVQIDDNFYLGKAHARWWWGKWQLIFYFSLQVIEA